MGKVKEFWDSSFAKKYKIRYLVISLLIYGYMVIGYSVISLIETETHYLNMSLDSKIPFIKAFIYPYYFHYILPYLSLWLLSFTGDKAFKIGAFSMLSGVVICHTTYIFYNVGVIRPDFEVNSFTTFLLNFTYMADIKANNCLPSLHALFGFSSAFNMILANKAKAWQRVVIALGGISTSVSTFFIKQHYVIDVIISLGIVIIMYSFFTFLFKKIIKD